jgi:hypothetical protein
MIDLKLTATGDLSYVNGDLELVSGREAIVQTIGLRLRFIQGEWFADTRVGMPYFVDAFGSKRINLALFMNDIRKAVLGTPGVKDMRNLNVTTNTTTRKMSVSFEILLQDDVNPIPFAADDLIIPVTAVVGVQL